MDSLSQMFNFLSLSTECLKLTRVKAGFDEQKVEGMKRPDAMTSYAEYLLNPPSEGEEEREEESESNLDLMELIEERERSCH